MLAVTIRRMCVKDRNRRIATPADLLAEFAKLGYTGDGAKMDVSFTPTAESERTVSGFSLDLDKLPKDAKDTLSFETDDVEIQAFVRKCKRRKLMKRLSFGATVALLVVLLVLVLTL